MKPHILFLLAILGMVTSFGQTSAPVAVTGKITDMKEFPIAGASIKVKGDIFGTTSDSTGQFRLLIPSLPTLLLVSHSGYDAQEINVTTPNVKVQLQTGWKIGEEVIVGGQRINMKRLNVPVTVELIDKFKISQSTTTGPYDLLRSEKGVDATTSSFNFNTYSTRGFNGSGSTRVNQIVDGMDNQAPGLNFPVGVFAGPTELDIESIELLPGASSALYGPGGMNGTILINSKSPFKHEGLSLQVRQGMMHIDKSQRGKASSYSDYSLRWAKAFNSKFAVKIGAQYRSAKDWLADDSTNYDRNGTTGKTIGGNRNTDPNYDGVNVYGDETSFDIKPIAGYMESLGYLPAGSSQLIPNQNVSRTGYAEKDIIDPDTKNIKLSGALHYKLTPKLEAILMGNWATGNTVYTDDNRYALKGIKIAQYKAELKHKDWFFRTYTTQENAGEAYSATVATQYFNEAWKSSEQWYPEYIGAYLTGVTALNLNDAQAHAFARSYADAGRPAPGSAQFNHLFDSVRKVPIPEGGLFKERSQLWMTEGQYDFSRHWKFAQVIVGANYKKYTLDSDGTLFIDDKNPIKINEFGTYLQVTKKLFDNGLTLSASGRFDKNENFKGKFTPRVSALIRLSENQNLRLSYQTAYRFPGNLAQWIMLDVGSDFLLLGGLPWAIDTMNARKYPVHQVNSDGTIDPNDYVFKEFKPETMRSFEIGYRALFAGRILVDAYAYKGKYEDFLGRIGLFQPQNGELYSIVVNSQNKVKTHGFGIGIDYRMQKNSSLFFNVYSDVITDVPDGFKSYFNTPKYRLNAGFANSGLGKSERLGFNVTMRWQDGFEWEGELANGPVKSFATIDAQVSYKLPKIKSSIRLGGTNITNNYYQNAFGNPRIGGLYYASFMYNL